MSEPLVTVNVKAPMRKEEFKQLPPSLQAEYIKSLKQNYDATATQIGEMLGYAQGYIHDVIKKLGLSSLFPAGGAQIKRAAQELGTFLIPIIGCVRYR